MEEENIVKEEETKRLHEEDNLEDIVAKAIVEKLEEERTKGLMMGWNVCSISMYEKAKKEDSKSYRAIMRLLKNESEEAKKRIGNLDSIKKEDETIQSEPTL